MVIKKPILKMRSLMAGISILVALAIVVSLASAISLNNFPVKLYLFQEELKAKVIERGAYSEAGGVFPYPSTLYDIELLDGAGRNISTVILLLPIGGGGSYANIYAQIFIPISMSIFHDEMTKLESLKVIFGADESTLLTASLTAISADKWIYLNNSNIYEPATRSTILSIPDFEYYGIGTVDLSLYCYVTILKPAEVGKVNLNIEVTLSDYTLLALTRYVGKFSIPLAIERSGTVRVGGS